MPNPTNPPKRPRGRPSSEPTVRLRVPESRLADVLAFVQERRNPAAANEPGVTIGLDPRAIAEYTPKQTVTKMGHSVPGGFPSPADDYVEQALDFNEHLIIAGHRDATFVLRVSGHSMHDVGIHDGDEVVVDRALKPKAEDIVVAVLNGEFTIKRLRFESGVPVLVAENVRFDKRKVTDGEELKIWGVVTRCC